MKDKITTLTSSEEAMVAGFKINPHPDGKAWAKCCTHLGIKAIDTCLCFMRKPTIGESRFEWLSALDNPKSENIKQAIDENGRFFCCHRETVDGYHRECAGWAAKFHPGETANDEAPKAEPKEPWWGNMIKIRFEESA